MSMMAYPSFLKVITGYLSWERRRGSKRERFSSRAATLAGHRGGAQREIGVKKTNELRWREERCDAADDDHFVGISAPGCIQLGPIPCLVGSPNEL